MSGGGVAGVDHSTAILEGKLPTRSAQHGEHDGGVTGTKGRPEVCRRREVAQPKVRRGLQLALVRENWGKRCYQHLRSMGNDDTVVYDLGDGLKLDFHDEVVGDGERS